jgi:hypothetical protein
MRGPGIGIICGPSGGRWVTLPPVATDDPWGRYWLAQFTSAYQAAVRTQRYPGKDPEVLRLLEVVAGGTGQPRPPGF